MVTTDIFALATGAIGLLSAVAMGVYSATNNASSVKDSVISAYEKRVVQLEQDVKNIGLKLDEMSLKFDKSEDARKHAEEILQGRNPELERFMTTATAMLIEIHAAVLPQTVSKA